MVLQIVLPEPNSNLNPHRACVGSSGSGGDAKCVNNNNNNNNHNNSNHSSNHNNGSNHHHHDKPEPWLRRVASTNSLTESRIGDDSLFSYEYGECIHLALN